MRTTTRFIILLCIMTFMAGCALSYEPERPRTKAEKWTGIDADEFKDKDTHMREFYKSKIAEKERLIRKNTEELEKLKHSNPTNTGEILEQAMRKDRLEREIGEYKKSKRNWEKVEKEYIEEQNNSTGGNGGGC